MRVGEALAFQDLDDLLSGLKYLGQERPVTTPRQELQKLIAAHEGMTAKDFLTNVLAIQTSAQPPTSEEALRVRIAAAKAAQNIYRSLTPAGKAEVRPLMRKIHQEVPDLRILAKTRGVWEGAEEAAQEVALPKDSVNPGLHLGQEKKRLGLSKEEFERRKALLKSLKAKAKMEGRILRQEESRAALDTRKPVPPGLQRMYERPVAPRRKPALPPPARREEAPRARPPEQRGVPPGARPVSDRMARMRGLGDYGYLAQAQDVAQAQAELDQYASRLESEYRTADVDVQVEILDRLTEARESANNVEDGTASIQDFRDDIGMTTPDASSLVYVVGGIAVLAVLYFLLVKK